MRSHTRITPTLLCAVVAFAAAPSRAAPSTGHGTSEIPEYSVADSGASAVTLQNLADSERFWPYHVSLTAPFSRGESLTPLGKGHRGVLIRVEPGNIARIDFGGFGLYEIPVSQTDLVERANQIRRGEAQKTAANFVLALGPRLVDSSRSRLVPYPFRQTSRNRAFLCVFADPRSEGFPAIAKALAPLAEREGVLTILFPQSEARDPEVREKLIDLEWRVPFVFDYLSLGYTESLIAGELEAPAYQLVSREGRVLEQGEWSGEAAGRIETALSREAAPGASSRPPGNRSAAAAGS